MGCAVAGRTTTIESKRVEEPEQKPKPVEEQNEVRAEPNRKNEPIAVAALVNEQKDKDSEHQPQNIVTFGDHQEDPHPIQVEENIKVATVQMAVVSDQDNVNHLACLNDMIDEDITNIPPYKNSNWPKTKKEFITNCLQFAKENEVQDDIKVMITKLVSINKNDYSQFTSDLLYEINVSNTSKEFLWNKKPLAQVKKSIMEQISNNNLLAEAQAFDWSRATREYEKFHGEFKMLKISKKNQDLERFVLKSSADINTCLIILIFTLSDEHSLLLFKEMINYRKKNKSFTFIPVYGEILENPNSSIYVWESLEKFGIADEDLEIYFVENDKLDKCFKYISDDNLRKAEPLTIVIDSEKIIRIIMLPDQFSFNIIENLSMTKDQFKAMKKAFYTTLIEKNKDSTFFTTPCKADLFLKKSTIYSMKEGVAPKVYYEVLYGRVEENDSFANKMNDVGHLKNREAKGKNKPSWKQRNAIVSQEMKNFLENVQLSGIRCISTYHRTTRIISITKNKKQRFSTIPRKTYQMSFGLPNDLFEQQFQFAITGALTLIGDYSYFGKINFLNAIPLLQTPFCSTMTLLNTTTSEDEVINIADTQKPSIMIIFSPMKEYLAKLELQARLSKLDKDLENYFDNFNIYLIYRGDVDTLYPNTEFLSEEPLLNRDLPVYVLSTFNTTFPLYYQNSTIETEDSQFTTIITDNSNKVVYVGNTDDLSIKNTLNQISEEQDAEITYKKNCPITYDYFNETINPIFKEIEKELRDAFDKEEMLLYKPFIEIGYNTNTVFMDTKEEDSYLDHFRLKILIKERHTELITKNKEIKEIIKKFKAFGGFVQIVPIPCAEIEIGSECVKCSKELGEKDPFYFNQDKAEVYCIDCEKTLEFNDVYMIYFKSASFDDEVIEEFYENNVSVNKDLDSQLGHICKICNGALGSCFYINMTHFNVISESSSFEPIDICQKCFECLGTPKMNFPNFKEKTRVSMLGLNHQHMIYRKIAYPS